MDIIMTMNLDMNIYTAFREGGLAEPQAKAVVSAITMAIDNRYAHHSDLLATKGDLAELKSATKSDLVELKSELRIEMANMKVDIIRWNVVTMFGAVGMIAAIMKFLH